MSATSGTPKSLKAQITRTSLVIAAAAILRENGPKAVTYRRVAEWANAASSSVGYYFDSMAQLLAEAGQYNINLWAERANKAATEAERLSPAECREQAAAFLVRACLPEEENTLVAHYEQLVAAAESCAVTQAYREGRSRRDNSIVRILDHAQIDMPADSVGVIVDGAAVVALSEGYDVNEFAKAVLQKEINTYEMATEQQTV